MADHGHRSTDRRGSSKPSNSQLLQTIAQLRAQRLRVDVESGSASEACETSRPADRNNESANPLPVEASDLASRLGSLSIGNKNSLQESDSLASSESRINILDSYVALRRDEYADVDSVVKSVRNRWPNPEVINLESNSSAVDDRGNPLSGCSSPPVTTVSLSSDEDDIFVTRRPQNGYKPAFSRNIDSSRKKNVSRKKEMVEESPQSWDLGERSEESTGSITFKNGERVYTLPGKIANVLYAHQQEGIKWLWGLHVNGVGGILGDDMGLGKTMQIAAFLAGLFASDFIKCAIIVAPKTLIAHWLRELSSVGLARKTKDYSGCSGNGRDHALQHVLQVGGVLLTTYDVVRNNWRALKGDFYGENGYGHTSDDIVTWDYIILDEGHLIKNPNTQRAKSLREIPSAHRIIVSGTPIQNNLREMWALFDFCYPQLLGDKKVFKIRYEDVILDANDKHATDRQRRIGSAVAKELRKRIAPFFLRRMKSDVFPTSSDAGDQKIARKNDMIVWLRLTECQRQLYSAFLESEAAHLPLDGSAKGSALAALSVLKKICDHPCLLTRRATDDIAEGMDSMLAQADAAVAEAMSASLAHIVEEDESYKQSDGAVSCKLIFILSLLAKLIDEGHRTLIFAQTRKMLNIIQKEIMLKRYNFLRIDGTTKASERETSVQEFQQNSQIPIFLLTSQVGGLGLTLTGANRVIIVDPAWNPSTDNQSVDRAHRIGQKHNVLVYRLMTCGTIEEKIYRKQVFKGGLFRVATEHKEQFRYFSQQELKELLSLPRAGFDISLTQQQLHEEHSSQYKIDEKLKEHIEFLEAHGIAGVSHHDLLFSKQAPVLSPPDVTSDSRSSSLNSNSCHSDKLKHEERKCTYALKEKTEQSKIAAIKENINRLSQTLADEATVSRLPDRGENIKRKIKDLTNKLNDTQNSSLSELSTTSMPCSNEEQLRMTQRTQKMIPARMEDRSLRPNLCESSRTSICNDQETSSKNSDSVIDLDEVSLVLGKLDIA